MGKSKPLKQSSFLFQLSILIIIMIFVGIISLSIGSVNTNIADIIDLFLGEPGKDQLKQIIFSIRLPRIVYAILIGGGLSITGAVFQAILVNPLAEPYILGISSGGTFGAVLSFILGMSFLGTQSFAFIGAFLVMILVFFLGKRYGDLEPNTLLLSGVMVGAFFSALILHLVIFLNESLRTAIYWMIGSLSFAKADNLVIIGAVTILGVSFLFVNSYKYNLLNLGNETAKTLGVNAKYLKYSTYLVSSILIGSLVSVSGIIGFVGLIVPHVCRLIWGIDNRKIIPASFFVGAIYLTIADTIARTIISPAELPVGAITAIIGAPIFIYLLKTRFTMT